MTEIELHGYCYMCDEWIDKEGHRCPHMTIAENRSAEYSATHQDLRQAHEVIEELEEKLRILEIAYGDVVGDSQVVATIADIVFGDEAPGKTDEELIAKIRRSFPDA